MDMFFSADESQGNVGEKMRDLLKNASRTNTNMEHNIRPKRKAAAVSRKKSSGQDSEIDDSDTDDHYKFPGQEHSSSDDSALSDNNNDMEPKKSAKRTSKS